MDPGILAAIQRLPRYETVIKELALRSESFRSLCRDLADAGAELQRRGKPQSPEDVAQFAEYRELVEALEAELRQAILTWQARSRGGRD
jgi:hypothetical protein